MRRTMKPILFALLATFALTGAACGKSTDTSSAAPKAETSSSKNEAGNAKPSDIASDRVVVYYFHGTRRCPTCLGIQKTIEQTIDDRFADEVAAGMLVFEEINYEEPAGKSYIEKFQLSFSSMIVATEINGKTVKWENANKVWDFAQDQPALAEYVEKSVRDYLKLLKGS
jgi:hypothetical protein